MMVSLLACVCLALEPVGAVAEDLPFEPGAWRARPQVEVRVQERGQATVYAGVPLATVLNAKGAAAGKQDDMTALRGLSDAVILARGADGYQAAVSAAAVAMDPRGEKYLLALSRDGKPLGTGPAAVRLVVPGDPRRVRWVRDVVSLRLVRFPSERTGGQKPAPEKPQAVPR